MFLRVCHVDMRDKAQSLSSVFLFCLLLLAGSVHAGDTYITTTDNENNAGTGVSDGDMDVDVVSADGNHPIEFNIDITGNLPNDSALLAINANDVDEEDGENNEVYLNGALIGSLSGRNNFDSTSVFELPLNQVGFGDNLVQLNITGPWTTRVDWGQILVDGGSENDAALSDFDITNYNVFAGVVTVDVATTVTVATTGNYRMELNVIDQNGENVELLSENFSANAGDTLTKAYSPTYSLTANDGVFKVEILLFYLDAPPTQLQSYQSLTFDHIRNSGPNLPAATLYSTLSTADSVLTADGADSTIITLQGIDIASNITTYSGQTVTMSTDAGTLSGVTDQGDGTYTATLVSPLTTSTATITATIDGVDVLDNTTVDFVPGPPSLANTTIVALPDSMEANGTNTSAVTVTAIDAFGNNLTQGGDAVVLFTDLGSLSAVNDEGDGTYTATLTTSTTAGTATISGFVNAQALLNDETVAFLPGAASVDDSTITASPVDIVANGSSTSTIIVQAVDSNGNNLISGGDTIQLATTRGSLGAVSDLGDGRYSAVLTSDTAAGAAVVSGTLNGIDIVDTETLTFLPGSAIAGQSTIVPADPSIPADGVSTTVITVQGIDAFGNVVTTGGAAVSMSTTRGTLSAVSDLGNGQYTATLTSTTVAGNVTVSASIDGTSMPDTAVVFFEPGPADPIQTTITAASNQLTANGFSSTTITVQTIDANGNNLDRGGNGIVLNTTSGSLSNVLDRNDGTYTATLTASTVVSTATVFGTINGIDIPDIEDVDFVPGPPSRSESTISASLESIVADGATQTQITIQAVDANGNFLTAGGDNFTLSSTAGTLSALTDEGDGTYTAIMTSTAATATATLTATLNGLSVADTLFVAFVSRPTVTPQIANTTTPVVSGTRINLPASSFSVTLDGQVYLPGDGNLVVSGSNWTLTVPSGNALSEGTYSVVASITDGAGQTTTDSSNDELVIDVSEPSVTLDSLSPPDSATTSAFPVTGDCDDIGDTLAVTVTDTQGNSEMLTGIPCTDSGGNGRFGTIIDLSLLEDGPVLLEVLVSDLSGNQDTDSLSLVKNACSPDNTVSACDADRDGVPNGIEVAAGTSPNVADTDGDGITDALELGLAPGTPPDSDGDGTIDALDLDSDNDSLTDALELGSIPAVPRDTDGDGIPDFQDRDSDNDWVPDALEFAYIDLDPDGDGIENFLDLDSDGDGIPDSYESGSVQLNDSDLDGIDDGFDVSETGGTDLDLDGIDDALGLRDQDLDGAYDMFDLDSDNDGMSDTLEADLDAAMDGDGDGINDVYDADATGRADTNNDGLDDLAMPTDTDADGVADFIDLDSDGDSVSDVVESGGTDVAPRDGILDDPVADAGQTLTPIDSDSDGLADHRDLESSNVLNNGVGPFDLAIRANVAVLDSNGDGRVDDLSDSDGDGIADVVDEDVLVFGSPEDNDQDGLLNSADLDDDNDGIPDLEEGAGNVDSDGDGRPDSLDVDSDNDGIRDLVEARHGLTDIDLDGTIDDFEDINLDGLDDRVPVSFVPADSDGDGVADFISLDADGDGLFDLEEANEASVDLSVFDADSDGRVDVVNTAGQTDPQFEPIDTDGDGIPDFQDQDSDGDGYLDRDENGDYNGDGINDRLQIGSGELSSGVRGVGSLGLFFLVAMVALLAVSRRFRSHQSPGLGLFVLVLSASLLPKPASAHDEHCGYRLAATGLPYFDEQKPGDFQSCFYGSAGLGAARLSPEGESQGWSVDEEGSPAASLQLGYHLNPHWMAEISYGYLGEAGLGNINPALDANIDAGIEYQAATFTMGYWLFSEYHPFNVYIKAGMARLRASATDERLDVLTEADTHYTVGAGVQYRISESAWFGRIGYQSFSKDAGVMNVEIGRYFGNESHSYDPADDESSRIPSIPFRGVPNDDDRDGVVDYLDQCPNTIVGQEVDASGCCPDGKECKRLY